MQYGDFSFNGKLASEMGVIVTSQVQYIRPQENTSTVQIPGRSGTVNLRGSSYYEQVSYTPTCLIKPTADREKVFSWLRGSGNVIFGSMPEYQFDARLANQIAYTTLLENVGDGYLTFAPVFLCQPYRYQATPDADITISTTASGSQALRNPGNVDAAPVITVVGAGTITITCGGNAMVLNLPKDGVIIDSEMMDCYDLNKTVLMTNLVDGEFPMIPAGDSTLQWTLAEGATITSVTVRPNWRWI